MNAADTAFILFATAMVLMMTLPGLALFYGGLVRARNVLSVFMQCFAIAALMSVLWIAFGYSVAFGPARGTAGEVWGGLSRVFLLGAPPDALTGTLPEAAFVIFQMTFAIITPALFLGAFAERASFPFILAFSGLWMGLVYAPSPTGSGARGCWPTEGSSGPRARATSRAGSSCMKPQALPPCCWP